ncbi:hypothetical protein [Paractinoplanes atraurantiacus]|uniref:Uncharacterized protein n=1 Tax=Paractinoplanes atraurantiacus TaxID=1036182 RepID=A0A285H2B1_9ACTN|nr:hypothetical protein [Actinoplanes atraurantiacus]SNY29714.1 hypothetical protein SAMN05421748_103293 [Actinoplanes atraurantiacus]
MTRDRAGATGEIERGGLGARYRMVLKAYPKGRRRDELLDTLLEAAPSDRRRPTVREGVNLVRHGMRARLGRPASKGVVVLAALVALIGGFLGAAVSARAAWEFALDHPSGKALEAISGTIFPGVRAHAEPAGDELFHDVSERSTAEVLLRGHDEDFEFSAVTITPDKWFIPGDYRSWTTEAQERLVREGWQVGDAEVTGATWIATGEIDDSGRTFSATRDGLAIKVESMTDVVDTPAGSFYASVRLDRLTPGFVDAATVLGMLAGALIGWLVTGWASRRTEFARTAPRTTTLLSSVVALVFLVPQALLGLAILVSDTISGGPPIKPFWSLTMTYGYGCALAGIAAFAVALIAAALARRPAPDPAAETP